MECGVTYEARDSRHGGPQIKTVVPITQQEKLAWDVILIRGTSIAK